MLQTKKIEKKVYFIDDTLHSILLCSVDKAEFEWNQSEL